MDESLGARKLLQHLVDHGFKEPKDIQVVADAFRHVYDEKKNDKGISVKSIFPKGTSAKPVAERFIAYLKYRKETIKGETVEKHSHHSRGKN